MAVVVYKLHKRRRGGILHIQVMQLLMDFFQQKLLKVMNPFLAGSWVPIWTRGSIPVITALVSILKGSKISP